MLLALAEPCTYITNPQKYQSRTPGTTEASDGTSDTPLVSIKSSWTWQAHVNPRHLAGHMGRFVWRVLNFLNRKGTMPSLSGPHPLSKQLQIKIPVKLARSLHLKPGDEVYWRLSDDDPGVLSLLPAEVVERRYNVGERIERSAHQGAAELGGIAGDQIQGNTRV
jgi:hypothetical protein